jgi:hypothetical protein
MASKGWEGPFKGKTLAGAVGIEIASLKNKSCFVNGATSLPFFQLVSNGFECVSYKSQFYQ